MWLLVIALMASGLVIYMGSMWITSYTGGGCKEAPNGYKTRRRKSHRFTATMSLRKRLQPKAITLPRPGLLSRVAMAKRDVAFFCNSHDSLSPEFRLGRATHHDVALVRKKLCDNRGYVYKNLTAAQLGSTIAATTTRAKRWNVGCFIYISMHGVGGGDRLEALIGEDGSMLMETDFRHSLNQYTPSEGDALEPIILVIDACHGGGMLNMPYTFIYEQDGKKTRSHQRGDGGAERRSPLADGVPCLCLTAVKEEQEAHCDEDSSIFTRKLTEELASRKPPLSSIDRVMTDVSRRCNDVMRDHGVHFVSPIVTFNDAFLRYTRHASGRATLSPEDLCSTLSLL